MRPTVSQSMRTRRVMVVGLGGQPGHERLEVGGEARPVAGDGHGFDPDAVGRASQSAQLGPDLQAPGPEVEMAPPGDVATSGLVGGAGGVGAQRADQLAPAEGHGDGHHPGPELHVGDADAGERQEALECSSDSHGWLVLRLVAVGAANVGRSPCASPNRHRHRYIPCRTTPSGLRDVEITHSDARRANILLPSGGL